MDKKIGVLCHITSLPSDYGIGDLGTSSRNFIDFLSANNLDIWQILPINVTNEYNCPYSTQYTFAIDSMLIDPNDLVARGLVDKKHLIGLKKLKNSTKVEYEKVKKEKMTLLEIAYSNINDEIRKELQIFIQSRPDIKNYSIFVTLLNQLNIQDWRLIPDELQDKTSVQYKNFVIDNFYEIQKHEFIQYLLFSEWTKSLMYARSKNIKILGDLPIYPDKNSFDVYCNKDKFKLDKNYNPKVTGGKPPDDLCKNGQDWGTCVYDWRKLKSENFDYLISKINKMFDVCDILRLDHFAGHIEHFENNKKDTTKNKWVKGGGEPLFNQILKKCNINNLVVEDLGAITPECIKIKEKYNLIGMQVLQLNLLRPDFNSQNISKNTIYYLGTHDNNTFIGYLNSLSEIQKQDICKKLKICFSSNEEILVEAMKTLLKSDAKYVIFQLQDLLCQDESARMNIPGVPSGVWEYKAPNDYKKHLKKILKEILS